MEAIAAIVIFVLMFALIILDKIPRHYITLGCAAATLIIVFGVCMKSPQAIMETLNLKTIITGNFWISSGESSSSGINWETIIWNGLNIRGIYGRKVWDTWYKMSTMIQAGLDISPIITHHFDIRDYEKGFEAMISGQSGKVILDWAHIND